VSDHNGVTVKEQSLKLHKIPAQIADPMTLEALQAMAGMRRKFSGFSD